MDRRGDTAVQERLDTSGVDSTSHRPNPNACSGSEESVGVDSGVDSGVAGVDSKKKSRPFMQNMQNMHDSDTDSENLYQKIWGQTKSD